MHFACMEKNKAAGQICLSKNESMSFSGAYMPLLILPLSTGGSHCVPQRTHPSFTSPGHLLGFVSASTSRSLYVDLFKEMKTHLCIVLFSPEGNVLFNIPFA